MSQAILNAIERAGIKRRRKWVQWWENKRRNPIEWERIEQNRIRFDREFAAGIPFELIPVVSPEPPME